MFLWYCTFFLNFLKNTYYWSRYTIFQLYIFFLHYWAFHGGGGGLVAKSCLTLAIPWTVACQVPLSMGLSRQEYWSGLPFPSPGDLSNPRIDLRFPALQEDDLPTELWTFHAVSTFSTVLNNCAEHMCE